jgi:hypothetical protein
MDLFIDSSLHFEKVASEVTLPEDPNAWPNEILQELFKQVPYIADFEPHVVMSRVDAERGFGFGHVEVMNKTEIQRGTSPEGMEAAGIRQARIPVIIKDRKLQPLDVVITEDSQMLPLTEPRLRQAIFRPQAFDITARTPGDMSMIGQLYPPYRQNYGFGGGGASMSVGMGKQGSDASWSDVAPFLPSDFIGEKTKVAMYKKGSILSSILPTIDFADHAEFKLQLESPRLQAAFSKNAAAMGAAVKALLEHDPIPTTKLARATLSLIQPTVFQVVADGMGFYNVKTASHKFWMPVERLIDRGALVREFGEKIALDTDLNGSMTMAAGDGVGAKESLQPEADRYEMIKDFGSYKVKTQDGRELVGIVFPNLLDTDGTPLPLFLFTNGSQSAAQGEIVGVRSGEATSIPEGHPRGHGAFYEVLTNGKAQATVPLTIQATLQMPDEGEGTSLHATTFDGRPVEVKVQPNITKVTAGDGVMLIPETMCWLPLDGSEDVVLMDSPEAAEAQVKQASAFIQVRAGGSESFSFSGPVLDKIASDARSFLSLDDALFMLAGLGVDLEYGISKLGQAMAISAPVDVLVGRDITPVEHQIEASEKTAATNIALFPSAFGRRSLLKEAAVLPDPVAVDTVLSLGFINPENVSTFVSYLPTLDESQKKMCEILVASRLGLRDVPVSALERAIRSVEEVIEGLKILAFQKN